MTLVFNRNKTRALILPMVVLAALSACDSSGTSVSSQSNNPTVDADQNSQPSSTLTFATQAGTDGNTLKPGESVLRKTMTTSDSSDTVFDDLQILVFGPMCAGCHIGAGETQPSVLDLTNSDATYASLVNQPSTHSPGESLIVPGNSGASYLIKTLEGTQASGSRMPMRAAAVSDELIADIRRWIDTGASR